MPNLEVIRILVNKLWKQLKEGNLRLTMMIGLYHLYIKNTKITKNNKSIKPSPCLSNSLISFFKVVCLNLSSISQKDYGPYSGFLLLAISVHLAGLKYFDKCMAAG